MVMEVLAKAIRWVKKENKERLSKFLTEGEVKLYVFGGNKLLYEEILKTPPKNY